MSQLTTLRTPVLLVAFGLPFVLPISLAQDAGPVGADESKLTELKPIASTTTPPDTLRWSNGDSLHGRLLSAKDNRLLWKSPLFVDPVEIDGRYLSLIEFGLPPAADQTVRDPLRVVFRNGDVLFAKLTAIDETFLTLTSQRHGTVRVRRDGVRMLERMDNPGLVYVGPLGTEDWTTLEQGQAFEKWQQTPDGPLATTGWLAELFRELPIPNQAEIEVTVQSTGKPKFLIAFDNRPDDSIRIETWDDELVALAGDDFEPILTINPGQKTVQLRLYLNRERGQLSIYSVAGKKLGEISDSKKRDTKPGFYLRNKGEQLQLNALRVSRWSGDPPQDISDRGSRIHLAKGTAAYGTLTAFDAATETLTLKDGNTTQSVPMNEVDRVFLADDEKDVPSDELAQAFYYDGTRITGNLVRIEDGGIFIRPNTAAAPIESRLVGMRRLLFRQPEDLPEDGNDRVYWDGGSLRGTLAGGDTPETAIQWRPVGALKPTNLAATSKARFVRSEKSEGIKYDRQRFNDMVFLTTRDVIPCRVNAIGPEFLLLETAFAEATRIPSQFVRAIELADDASGSPSGPRDRTEISDAVRQRALLIPRFRRDNPSTHVLIAPNGDILRGRLLELRDGQIHFESQLEPFKFDRSRVASIVWLHPTGVQESPDWDSTRPVVRAVLNGNLMVSLQPERMVDGRLVGISPLLGRCAVPVGSIVELQAGGFGPIDDAQVYANWTPQPAPEPDIPNPDGPSQNLTESPLVGTPARNFSVDLLDGGRTSLKDLHGRIVVLDFWASWCGPCVRAMPEVIKVTDEFADRGVVLLALNQEEQEKLIGAFLISNGLKANVGLDRTASIARQFGVDTIPQTFVIDQQGLIAAHAIGATPGTSDALRAAIEALLEPKSNTERPGPEGKPADGQ
ncbi:redoxin domain-containing protein [bacterium]|nr:redoxin domain-containing protein [bacterium]